MADAVIRGSEVECTELANAGVKLLETVIASKGSQSAHRKGKVILARMGEGRPCRIGGFFQRREVIGFR